MLDRNIEAVDEFFNSKLNEYNRRLSLLIVKYNPTDPKIQDLDIEELEDLLNSVLELRSQFRKLQWYSEVNKRGFVKILKKLDKKIHIQTQKKYLNSKVLILPFANGSSVEAKLALINNFIEELSPLISNDSAKAADSTEGILKSARSSLSDLSLTSKKNGIDSEIATSLKKLTDDNDAVAIQKLIEENNPAKKILVSCIYKGLSNQSYDAVKVLLAHINVLQDSHELNGRTILHKLVINKARQRNPNQEDPSHMRLFLNPAYSPAVSDSLSKVYGSDGVNSNDDAEALSFILDNIPENQHETLVALDEFGRTPLHYAAQHGLKLLTQVLLDYMRKWKLTDNKNGWKDADGVTPIQLAVAGNHPVTTKLIIDSGLFEVEDSMNLLHVAGRLGSSEILEYLLSHSSLDINHTSDPDTNETCLYIVSKLAFLDCVKILLNHDANTEIKEAIYGWTPLFIAAVEGHIEVVKLLVSAGSNIDEIDGSGWTAMEHATFRGHLVISDLIKPPIIPGVPLFFGSGNNTPIDSNSPVLKTEEDIPDASNAAVKTFGHRYLQGDSLVLVNLGSMDMRDLRPSIQLDSVPYSKASSTQLDTALSLVVSCKNNDNDPYVVDLPITEGQSNEQFSFITSGTEDITIYFDLVPTYYGNKTKILGRGVGLISEMMKQKESDKMVSLHRTFTVPILETSTLQVLGKLRFQFLVINSFDHPKIGVAKSATYWKQLITTRVVGHRGLGKNSTNKSLQLGENTLESFIQAANLGASYVEFDVQLTKDFVPIVYHDFLVSETGIDIPTQSITLEQFLSISDQQTNNKKTSRKTSPGKKGDRSGYSSDDEDLHQMQRSKSMYEEKNGYEISLINERMKNTRDFKLKGFKGNTRGHSIQSPVTTLEHVFKTVPKTVGFNIECKYPMLDESQHEDMDTYAIELNFWVDTVLKCVYDNADGRDIIFSSFHPEICIMLSLKQPSIPVLFLTEGGTSPMQDIRASSLQEAIRLAKRWDLLGIVSESTPLVECPRLVNVVKENGLVCVTYGTKNNDPIVAKEQIQSGVDAVIVDSVLAVRKGLTID